MDVVMSSLSAVHADRRFCCRPQFPVSNTSSGETSWKRNVQARGETSWGRNVNEEKRLDIAFWPRFDGCVCCALFLRRSYTAFVTFLRALHTLRA